MDDAQKRKRFEMLVKWGMIGAGALALAPIIFMVVQGLAGLALAGLIALVSVNAAPVVAFKLANQKLKMLKAEAAANPIETMQLEYQRRIRLLLERRDQIVNFQAEVENYKDQLENFKEQWPEDGPKFQAQLETMQRLLARRNEKYQYAKAKTDEFAVEIQRADAVWKMTEATKRLHQSAGELNDEFLAKLKTDTAFNSVQKAMNSAFAELEMELKDDESLRPFAPTRSQPQLGDGSKSADLRLIVNDDTKVPR